MFVVKFKKRKGNKYYILHKLKIKNILQNIKNWLALIALTFL